MKIIDFIIHGNQVKFFLGANNCNNYWGDDWNDVPYEHNAGTVYNEFVEAYFIKTFDWDFIVREPSDGANNGCSRYSKEDMIKRRIPCVVALDEKYHDHWDYSYDAIIGNENAIKFYFGDIIDEEKEEIIYLKERKNENLYIKFSCDADESFLNMISNMIGISLKYFSNNKRLRDFDEKNYKKIEELSIYDYEIFIREIIKNTCIIYNIENSKNIINTIKLDLVKSSEINKEYEKNFYICCQSDNNFDIGEVLIR